MGENFLHGSFIMILMGHVLTHRRDSFSRDGADATRGFLTAFVLRFLLLLPKSPKACSRSFSRRFFFFLVAIPIDIMTGITL